ARRFRPRVPTGEGRGKGDVAGASGRLGRLVEAATHERRTPFAVQEPDLQHTEEPASTAVLPKPEPVAPPPAPTSSAMVVFENVTKIYEPDVAALRDVTFAIDKGEFVFIVGASGSGKSTLVRLVLKELEPTSGTINVGGRDLGRL